MLAFTAAQSRAAHRLRDALFFGMAAMLTYYLWFDDFFMFHEALGPHLLGINEKLIYASIGLAGAIYLAAFRLQIYHTQYLWLLASMVCLGLSVATDLFIDWLDREGAGWWFLIEDGLKWFGIVMWARYHVGTSARRIAGSGERQHQWPAS